MAKMMRIAGGGQYRLDEATVSSRRPLTLVLLLAAALLDEVDLRG